MHYTKAELAAVKKKMGLRWVNSWQGVTLQAGKWNPHFGVECFIAKGTKDMRYKLRACRSDLRVLTEGCKPYGGTNLLGTFDSREAAMAFAEWLLPAVDRENEVALALRREKTTAEHKRQAAAVAVRAAKHREATELVAALAARGVEAKVAFGGTNVEIAPAELRKLLADGARGAA